MPTSPVPVAVVASVRCSAMHRRSPMLQRVLLALSTPVLLAAVQAHAADDAATALPAITVSSYPAPMLDVDGTSKYVAVVASRGVEIRRCQHMVVTSRNYMACELNEGSRSYNVVIPIVRDAVDIREPWSYVAPGVYR